MQDYEQRGSFYLGRDYDLANRKVLANKVLYDSSDLTTHAVCVGMTGSGKTGLCLSLIEEAALDGIPVIAVDPKGDLGNLLLAFPELLPEDFQPWVDPSVAAQKGITPAELAEKTASTWRNGLAEWDESSERIQQFNNSVDKVIYTPGSSAGIPLTVLKSFHAPPQEIIDDTDTYRDLVQSTTQGVFALLGLEADPVKSREAILVSNILDHAWRAGRSPDLAGLIHDIQQPPFSKVGIIDLETFLPAAARLELGMKLNNLLASPSFASWLEGSSLDVGQLLYTAEKKPRLSILSIAHLNDAERMFFVTILLNEIVAWMRSQPGTGSLRAILYMDEVFGYFPPTANPPSKKPMLTLLKQARAYGLGVVLATQNPVDLDYKGLSNAGTWFLGRLQTERDKLRVLEGLEGASTQAGTTFNRGEMQATLAALGSRVFLMNNVHENQPRVFHTRWAMSYLRGPLTRDQIRTLMQSRRAEFAEESKAANTSRPLISGDIEVAYWPVLSVLPENCKLQYRPGLLGKAKLRFVDPAGDLDRSENVTLLQELASEVENYVWSNPEPKPDLPEFLKDDEKDAEFGNWPSEITQARKYKIWEEELKHWLYESQRKTRWKCNILNLFSEIEESDESFRARIAPLAKEQEKRVIQQQFDKELQEQQKSLNEADEKASEFRWWWLSGLGSILMRGIEIVLIRLSGGRTRKQLVTATVTSQIGRNRRHYAEAKAKKKLLEETLKKLEIDKQRRLQAIEREFRPETLKLEKVETAPRKSDIEVGRVMLVWLPWKIDTAGNAEPAW